ncbi:MAG: dihydrofolate reductase [Candidatus Andersenbacteria bacterium]|nr:dihydrofolate reductase [Candidatus Andersenbacteria bacterium]MBI3250930.1 dihydrofolate reductase [Candidatus Andersenbacteria bacterium]
MISIIAAVAKNGVIGKNNLMPWHLPQEMKLFRTLTEGKPVIIGRRTFESLPNLLDNRFLIVLSNKLSSTSDTVQFVPSIPDALETAGRFGSEIMVAGGELVYQQFLPIADRLYISHIHDSYEGDAFFPRVTKQEWIPQTQTHYDNFSFVTYTRAYEHAKAA